RVLFRSAAHDEKFAQLWQYHHCTYYAYADRPYPTSLSNVPVAASSVCVCSTSQSLYKHFQEYSSPSRVHSLSYDSFLTILQIFQMGEKSPIVQDKYPDSTFQGNRPGKRSSIDR